MPTTSVDGANALKIDDEITIGCMYLKNGDVVEERTKAALTKG